MELVTKSMVRTFLVVGRSQISDVELWHSSLSGDGAAFTQLFDRHRDRVFHHALRLVEIPADGEDVTAISFIGYGAAKTRLSRARGRLRIALEPSIRTPEERTAP